MNPSDPPQFFKSAVLKMLGIVLLLFLVVMSASADDQDEYPEANVRVILQGLCEGNFNRFGAELRVKLYGDTPDVAWALVEQGLEKASSSQKETMKVFIYTAMNEKASEKELLKTFNDVVQTCIEYNLPSE